MIAGMKNAPIPVTSIVSPPTMYQNCIPIMSAIGPARARLNGDIAVTHQPDQQERPEGVVEAASGEQADEEDPDPHPDDPEKGGEDPPFKPSPDTQPDPAGDDPDPERRFEPAHLRTRRGRREKAGLMAKLISIAIPITQRSPFQCQT